MGSTGECHPALSGALKAKINGAKLIHVDPRFTRTSANCDIHASIRAGSTSPSGGPSFVTTGRWNTDPFQVVVANTHAATVVIGT